MSDLDMWVNNVSQNDADEMYIMVKFLSRNHTVGEWFLLKDDPDAYIEFLESLLEE